jgi:hypothetical protein
MGEHLGFRRNEAALIERFAAQARLVTEGLLTRVLAVAAVSLPASAAAFELAAGFALIEEGDDRTRPGIAVHAALTDFYMARAYYYGREFGPVREETYLLAAGRRFGLFKSNYVVANVGVCAMDERIKLSFDDTDNSAVGPSRDRTEENFNFGGTFGISAGLPKSASPLYVGVSWDSHVFPAGLAGGLFLSSGRKQTISILMGAAL